MLTEPILATQSDRRHSRRWPCDKEIRWRIHGGRRVRVGRVAERSLNGMVIAAPAMDLTPPGTYLKPAGREASLRHGFHTGVVRRVGQAGHGEDLLFIEILS